MQAFLLDTNVVSELMLASPNMAVINWLKNQADAIFCSCAVTKAEILLGVALLPEGKRKAALLKDAELTFEEDFNGSCLPFDERAAEGFATLVVARRKLGKPIDIADAQIAAIALNHNLVLVTRNSKDFDDIQGLMLINPGLRQIKHER